MDKLQWIFELIDKVSGPANAASASMERVDRSLNRASGSSTTFMGRLGGLGAAFSRMTFAILPTVVALGQIAGAGIAVGNVLRMMGVNTATLRAGLDSIKGGAARAVASLRALGARAWAALKKIPPSAYLAGAAIAGIGVAAWGAKRAISALLSPFTQLASMTISAAPFLAIAGALATVKGQFDMIVSRQRLVRGFDVMLGEGQGERVMQRLVGLSEMMGTDINETATAARELFSKGFDENRVFELVQGFADLRSVNPGASLDRIALAMGQVRQAGRLQGDELNQLAEGGLNLSRVMPRIAAELGIDTTQVRDAMSDGRITSDIFERAVLGAMQDQAHGTIGSIAQEMSHTLGGEFERLQQAPDRFFERVARGGTESTDRLTGSLRRINEMLDPDSASGQKTIAAMAKALDMLADAMDWLTSNQGNIDVFFGAIGAFMKPTVILFDLMVWAVTAASKAWQGWTWALGTALGWLTVANARMMSFLTGISASFGGFFANMYMFGQNMVMGLVNGLVSLAMLPVQIIQGMGTNILNALRGALGIHSPSAEFAYLGEMVGAGFSQGLERSGMGSLGDISPTIGAPSGRASMMGANITIQINVDATSEPTGQSIAQQIRAALLPELSSAFDALAMEAGV